MRRGEPRRNNYANCQRRFPPRNRRINNQNLFQITNAKRLTNEEALDLLDQIKMQNSKIRELIDNQQFMCLLETMENLNKSIVLELTDSINLFVEWNSGNPDSIKRLFALVSESNFISNVLSKIITQFVCHQPLLNEIETTLMFFINCFENSPLLLFEQIVPLYPTILMSSEPFSEANIRLKRKQYIHSFEVAKNTTAAPRPANIGSIKSSKEDHSSFRNIPIIPGSEDIFCLNEEVLLKANRFFDENHTENNRYESVDDYLDTQFRLLREDFIRPLRESIAKIRENLLYTDKLKARDIQVRIYNKVIIEDLLPSRNGIVYKIKFDISKFPEKMDWTKSRRFIHGSLLCFTNNYFKTVYFASVVESDPKSLSKGYLMVQFEDDPISEILNNNEFMMLETQNLFEAYRHVLGKLQNFTLQTLPFQKYFAFAENKTNAPKYMSQYDINVINSLPLAFEGMDESQMKAFTNSLISSISLIQGPPGTGKTYVGLQIIKYLSAQFQTRPKDIGPILVVCYTNHALDQFLSEIISELGVENVLRVGGRSKLEEMQECNITTLKRKWVIKKRFPHKLYKQCILKRQQLEALEDQMVDKYAKITNLNKKLLSFNDLFSFMNHRDRKYFQNIDFDNWLKGSDVLLGDPLPNPSRIRNDIMIESLEELTDELVSDSLIKMAEELYEDILKITNQNDIKIEDTEEFLFNQRFLDEDTELIKSMARFKNIYKRNIKSKMNNSYLLTEYSDEFKTVANAKLIKKKIKKIESLSDENYQQLKDLDVDFDTRLKLYKYWFEKYQRNLIDDYKSLKVQYNALSKSRKELNNQEYELIMREIQVIGMTTTGAARYGSILDRVGCKVVVIEEAAEVLEAHVICSLSQYCEHLIMIGDHKQLRPKVEVYDLELHYKLGISLFERLIANKCQYYTLKNQHRMRPEISECVRPIYPDLQDSPSVFRYLDVTGMKTNLYFFHHINLEEETTTDTSYKNYFEAKFISEFCRYLLDCGNLASKITVLTFYSGQLYTLHNYIKGPRFKGIRICVVDNFQGEENDIVILSLVRSNRNEVIGFLKSPNRLCVALSRAKRGFYVIGNMVMLSRKIELLRIISENHATKKNVGSKLPLKCALHQNENDYTVTHIGDFSKGCPSVCGVKLNCGHSCTLKCHTKNPSHKSYKCPMPCQKLCKRKIHGCKLACGSPCRCMENLNVTLNCGHKTIIFCYANENSVKCHDMCTILLKCGHECQEECFKECICKRLVTFDLPCGHTREALCGSDVRLLQCVVLCEYILPCNHTTNAVCGSNVLNIKCSKKVQKVFPCGHRMVFKCSEIPGNCVMKINIKLKCNHEQTVLCGNRNEIIKCTEKCNVELKCSHKCQFNCGDCLNGRLHKCCQEKCQKKLGCRHFCKSLCHSNPCPPCHEPCRLGCLHRKCDLKCFEICSHGSCLEQCEKMIFCRKCKKINVCPKLCGDFCFPMCKLCVEVDSTSFIEMNPCYCRVKRSEFRPNVTVLEDGLELACQQCNTKLSLPYDNLSLRYYNASLSKLFSPLSNDQLTNWSNLMEKIKILKITDNEIVEEIATKIKNWNIFNSKDEIFLKSYQFYEEILDVSSKLQMINDHSTLIKFDERVRRSIKGLIKWLDPTIRRFDQEEVINYQMEKDLIILMIEIIQFLLLIQPNEYALVFKEAFALLETLDGTYGRITVSDFRQMFMNNIKSQLNNYENSKKAEKEIVERVITAKDILKEFKISHLSQKEKLKEVKALIKKCHPDKNRSPNAATAFRFLNNLKEKLKPKPEP